MSSETATTKYTAQFIAEAMWVCAKGEPGLSATIHDSREEAQDKADAMNWLETLA